MKIQYIILTVLLIGCYGAQAQTTNAPATNSDSGEAKAWESLGRQDVCYDTAQDFYRQSSRWPTNFVELTDFAHSAAKTSHNPAVIMFKPSFYVDVKLKPKANGNLEIKYRDKDSYPSLENVVLDVDIPKH